MFTIIWESKDDEVLYELSHPNNESYLIQNPNDYKILGEFCIDDYDVFSSIQMDAIILELERLKKELLTKDDVYHINEIIDLANKCKNLPDSRLIFTPFQK